MMYKLATLALIAMILFGCGQPYHNYKYTIWQGTAIFATGAGCDAYKDTLGYISFNGSDNKFHIIPKNQVKEIEVNY